MLKKVLLNTIKALFAIGLLWWLAQSGKLNWNVIEELKNHPKSLLAAFFLCFLNLVLCTWRWRKLLAARSSHLMGSTKLFFVNWIGMFFSSALPGSVTGDIIKVFYVRQKDTSLSMPFLLFSCFVDRLMGLIGLILLIGINSVINYQALMSISPKIAPILNFNFVMLAGLAVALVGFFLLPSTVTGVLRKIENMFPEKMWPVRLSDLWRDLVAARPQMGVCIVLSVVVQFIGAMIFHLLASPLYTAHLPLSLVLSFIPLGFIAVAIPIAPGGLGVGHAAFQSLFAIAGEENGANFFNLYFVVMMVFNLLGFIPWLALRRK